jgi:hypothetical protein
VLQFGACLDNGVARIKRDLIASALCWSDENRDLIAWIHRQHAAATQLSLRTLELVRAADRDGTLALSLSAAAFLHWGETVKWALARERPDYRALHDLFTSLGIAGRHRESVRCTVDGRRREACVEGLYFRALLLDRFNSGSLTHAQLEILDAWLWEWMDDLRGERRACDGPALRVDIDMDAGLRDGLRNGDGASLYLPLDRLERRRRAIVRALHCGRLVPAHGCGADIRIEEHVGLLDHLRVAFGDPAAGVPQRAPRAAAGRARVEIWSGVTEILARGCGALTETGYRAVHLSDPSIEEQSEKRYAEAARRYLWLVDESASGMGFEALESDAQGIEAGDLLGWRRGEGHALEVARVTRRLPAATNGQVFFGVQRIGSAARPVTLSQVVSFDNGGADGAYLFVPGDDASGVRDAFLLPESAYDPRALFQARAAGQAFTLRFNRTRVRGRGWLLAGFEVVPPQPAEPERIAASCDLPTLELAAEEMEDPWSREVRERLT